MKTICTTPVYLLNGVAKTTPLTNVPAEINITRDAVTRCPAFVVLALQQTIQSSNLRRLFRERT